MQINVDKPQTLFIQFKDLPKRFTLVDDKGRTYYNRYLNGKTPRIKFNIVDPGVYRSYQNFTVVRVTPIEVPYTKLPALPPAERNRYKDTYVVVNPALNNTPARIFSHSGKIEVSPTFKNYSKPVQVFLILHEQGHLFYSTEEFCDLWALVNFLRLGYNRSTAFYVLDEILHRSDIKTKRVKSMFENITKIGAFQPY